MNQHRRLLPPLAAVALFAACAIGCDKHAPKQLGLDISPPSNSADTIQVDVFGANEDDYDKSKDLDPMVYFASGNPIRQEFKDKGLVKSFTFPAPNQAHFVLDQNDPIWALWKTRGAKYLFVLTDVPLQQKDIAAAGGNDRRKLILPLDKSHWKSDKPVMISVSATGLSIDQNGYQ